MIHLRQQIIDAREGDGTCRRVQPDTVITPIRGW